MFRWCYSNSSPKPYNLHHTTWTGIPDNVMCFLKAAFKSIVFIACSYIVLFLSYFYKHKVHKTGVREIILSWNFIKLV